MYLNGADFAVMAIPTGAMDGERLPLGLARLGFRGRVEGIEAPGSAAGHTAPDLEMRLIEIGFLEGVIVEIVHEGVFGRDPIAVRLNDSTIALRRKEAMAVIVRRLEKDS